MEPLLANLQNGQMKVALGQLTIRQCTIIMMSFYGGYTLHEIAVCLEEPPERIHTCAQVRLNISRPCWVCLSRCCARCPSCCKSPATSRIQHRVR